MSASYANATVDTLIAEGGRYTTKLTYDNLQKMREYEVNPEAPPPPKKARTTRQKALETQKKRDPHQSSHTTESRKAGKVGKTAPIIPAKYSTLQIEAAKLLGFEDSAEYLRLSLFLQQNGNFKISHSRADGACFFHSTLAQLDCCQEYTQMHLRRDLVHLAAVHADYLFDEFCELITQEYDVPRISTMEFEARSKLPSTHEDVLTYEELKNYNTPGPFSYIEWLQNMLKPDFWADAPMVLLTSFLLQTTIAVIDSTTLSTYRYRNELPLDQHDLVYVYRDGNHYMPCCKY